MRKVWVGAGAVAAVAAIVATVPFFIDWNWFKPELVSAVESATGYEVEVGGDLGFALLPSPRLTVADVRVTGFGADRAPLIAAKSLDAAVAFWPLLSKKIEINYVDLVAPQVRLLSYADGSNNWRKADTAAPDRESTAFSIRDFRISDGTLVSRNAKGEEKRIDAINVQLGIASNKGPYELAGTMRYGALPLDLRALYQASGDIRLNAKVEDVAEVDFTGRMGTAEGDAPTPIKGDLAVKATSLDALLDQLDDKDDDSVPVAKAYLDPVDVKLTLAGTTERVDINSLVGQLGGSQVNGRMTVALDSMMRIDGGLSLGRVDAQRWMRMDDEADKEPTEIPDNMIATLSVAIKELTWGKASLGAAKAPVQLAQAVVTLGDMQLTLPGGGQALVSARVDAPGGKVRANGRYSTTLPRPAATLAAFDFSGPSSLPPASAQGSFAYADDMLSLPGMTGRFDGQPFKAGFVYPFSKGKAQKLTLDLAALNFDRIGASRPRKTEDEAPMAPLDFNVTLGQFAQAGSVYRGIQAAGRYADGNIVLSRSSVRDAMGFALTAKGQVKNATEAPDLDLAVGLVGADARGNVSVKGKLEKMTIGGGVNYAGAAVTLNGWARSKPDLAYDLTLHAKAADAGQVFAKLNDSPSRRMGALDFSLKASGKSGTTQIQIVDGKIGSMTLAGQARVDTRGAKPVVVATLTAGDVPLSTLMGDAPEGAQAAVADAGQRWSDDRLPLDWLDRFGGKIDFSAKRLTYGPYVFDAPKAALGLGGNALAIQSFNAGVFGGKLALSGRITGGAVPALALNASLTGIPVEPFLKATTANASMTGTMNMTANVTARGASQKAFMTTLAGPVKIGAYDGAIRKIDLAKLDQRLGTLTTVNDFLRFAGTALKGGETPYKTLSAELEGKGGRFTIVRVVTDLQGGSGTATGYVDIGQWQANVDGRLKLGSHEDAPAIPATIKGPLSTPTVSYNLEPMKVWFGKRLAVAGIKAAVKGEGFDPGDLLGIKKPATNGATAPPAANGTTTAPATPAPAVPAPQPATPKTVDQELQNLLGEGLGKLFKKKQPATPAPTDQAPAAEPAP